MQNYICQFIDQSIYRDVLEFLIPHMEIVTNLILDLILIIHELLREITFHFLSTHVCIFNRLIQKPDKIRELRMRKGQNIANPNF